MRERDASPFLLHAIKVTGGLVEWNDRRPPTWDGARWHFARIESEGNALHEIAHWIAAPPAARALPNYGLGTDPDDGPATGPDLVPYLSDDSTPALLMLAREYQLDPVGFGEMVETKLSHEECVASLLTIILLRCAGRPWAERMRKLFGRLAVPCECGCGESEIGTFWGFVATLGARGVDLVNPLAPFEAKHVEATGERR